MTCPPKSCCLHMQPASPARYATISLLLWRPLPASGPPAAGQGCYLCTTTSHAATVLWCHLPRTTVSFAPMQASIC